MRQRTFLAGAMAAITVLVLITAPAAAEEATGVVHGQIANWSEGGGNVEQVPITLNKVMGTTSLGSSVTLTGANGTFEFTGLETSQDYTYQISLVYDKAEYNFTPFAFEQGQTEKNASLVVYGSTTSDENVKVSRAHVIVKAEPAGLQVMEYYMFANTGDKAFIGEGESEGTNETLHFSLPADAVDFQSDGLMDCCIMWTADGVADTMPVFPGSKEILFQYTLGVDSESYELPLTLHYPVDSVDLMVQGEGVEIACDQLVASDPVDMGGTEVIRYTGQSLAPNTTLDILLSGFSPAGNSAIPWQIVGPVILVVGSAAGIILWRRRRFAPATAVVPARKELLLQLVELDEAFERGELPEDEYRSQRAGIKARIMELSQTEESD